MKIHTSAALSILAFAPTCRSWSATRPLINGVSASVATRGKVSTVILHSTTESSAQTKYADPSRYINDHPKNNVPPHIAALVGRGLHVRPDHPIGIVRAKIQEYFANLPNVEYKIYDAEDPIVTTTQCFDDLRIPRTSWSVAQ